MGPFLYLPHVMFVARHGLDHFEESMRAQYELTQRFSAEFSIRAFLERHPQETLARLARWANDPNEHVRRLVSEGTRPRLPWAPRLRDFQRDPRPVIALLEKLKDDPSLYVRRSVANNLNDIGKDHPELLFETARAWMRDASPERRWVVSHALRSAVKRGEVGALEVLGYTGSAKLVVERFSVLPAVVRIGESVTVSIQMANRTRKTQSAIVDFRVHFVKANGRSSPKVFKLEAVELAPGGSIALTKKVSLAQLTTRRHYPGRHELDIVINGRAQTLGEFILRQ